MLRKVYDRMMQLAAGKNAMPAMAAISFIESSIFPIPPDVMLIPMVLANKQRAFVIATVCTIASVLGGFLGYFIGAFFFDLIGEALLNLYAGHGKYEYFEAKYNEWGAWAVFMAGVTPFPYKVITIMSGIFSLSLPVFFVASVAARGLRFFAVAGLLWYFGDSIKNLIEKHFGLISTAFFVLLFGGFLILKVL